MMHAVNPPGTDPALAYSHGVITVAGRTLHVSGQVALAKDGSVPEGIAAQAALAFENLLAVLAAAGMGVGDLIKLTVFLTSAADVAGFRTARGAVLGGRKPTSTLLIVSALADPRWIVEVEAIAYQPG